MLLTRKCLSGNAPSYHKDMLCYNYRRYAQRRGTKLTVPNVKNKTFASRAFSVFGPREWNSLPMEIKKETDIEKFKSLLKTHYLIQVFNLMSDFI